MNNPFLLPLLFHSKSIFAVINDAKTGGVFALVQGQLRAKKKVHDFYD